MNLKKNAIKKQMFILSLLVCQIVTFMFGGFVSLATEELDEKYVPSDLESQCYIVDSDISTKYDHASGCLYYYGVKGSSCVGWLDSDGFLWLESLGNLAIDKSESIQCCFSREHYDKDNKLVCSNVDRAYLSGVWYQYKYSSLVFDELLSYGDFVFHMKIFNSRESAISYAETGDKSGLINDSTELNDSNSTYNANIGYLQNVKFNSRNVGSDNSDLQNMTYYFSYDEITNTGFDINQDGVRVSLYTKYQGIYYDSWVKYFKKDGNVKTFDDRLYQKSVDKAERLEFSYEDLMSSHASEKAETAALCESSVPTFGRIEYWLRVEYQQADGTWTYGGWVNCTNKSSSIQGDSIVEDNITQTYDNEGNLDLDGGYGSGTSTPHTFGEGSTMDEADSDAAKNEAYKDAFESIDDFGEGLELMKEQLGNIPQVISEVFLALPSALIVAITSGFFVCIVLRILGR